MPSALPQTRSAAAASSSATQTSVTMSSRPSASSVPRRSTTADMPAQPIATSVTPLRQGRPKVSEIITPTETLCSCRILSTIRLADLSLSSGNSAARPRETLERSMPAFAQINPCFVSVMIKSPRRRRIRTASRSTIGLCDSGSLGSISAIAPSALETIFCVTTRTSPSISPHSFLAQASPIKAPRSSPSVISGIPLIG